MQEGSGLPVAAYLDETLERLQLVMHAFLVWVEVAAHALHEGVEGKEGFRLVRKNHQQGSSQVTHALQCSAEARWSGMFNGCRQSPCSTGLFNHWEALSRPLCHIGTQPILCHTLHIRLDHANPR